MDFWQGFWLITGVQFLAAMSPGPDFILVTQQALTRSRKAGVLTGLGVALGFSVHVVYSVLGLAAVVAASSSLLAAIKIAGGSYLIYLGVKGLRAKPQQRVEVAEERAAAESAWAAVRRGFWCNVLNPKAAVFMVSLFTVVLSPDMPVWQLAVYGVWMAVLLWLWFAAVAFVLSVPSVNRKFQHIGHWIDRVFGSLLVLLGIKVMLAR